MKNLKTQKRMAAEILNAGTNKVWFDPSRILEIKEAITKQDIIDLIKDKCIKKKPKKGQKRRTVKRKISRNVKGRRKGSGKIRRKIIRETYLNKIRKLRAYLKFLKKNKGIKNEKYRLAYNLIKAGFLKNKEEIKQYLDKKI
jgi:large subunit ribosomal protein L19e